MIKTQKSILFSAMLLLAVLAGCHKDPMPDIVEENKNELILNFHGDVYSTRQWSAILTNEKTFVICGTVFDVENRIVFETDGQKGIRWLTDLTGLLFGLPNEVLKLPSGEILVCGNSDDQGVKIITLNAEGQILSDHTHHPENLMEGDHIIHTLDGNLVIMGRPLVTDLAPPFMIVIKVGPNGEWIWEKRIDATSGQDGIHILELSNGNMLITSISNPISYYTVIHFILLDPDGEILWDKEFGQEGWNASTSIELSDGNILSCGTMVQNSIDSDIFLMKITPGGELLWSGTIGVDTLDETAFTLTASGTNEIVIGGRVTNPNLDEDGGGILILKTDLNGNIIWSQCTDYTMYDYCGHVHVDGDLTIHGVGGKDGRLFVTRVDKHGMALQ